MNRNFDVSPETHFHIRWANGMRDWERHNTRVEAEQSATQLARPGEMHTIEECHETGGMEISGKLITDLHPNGSVRMVFIPQTGGGYGRPLVVSNLDAAKNIFIHTLRLTPEKAATLWAELSRNKIADITISIDTKVAEVFCNQPLRQD